MASETFPQFPRLPVELRQIIWKAALPPQRILEFEFIDAEDLEGPYLDPVIRSFESSDYRDDIDNVDCEPPDEYGQWDDSIIHRWVQELCTHPVNLAKIHQKMPTSQNY
jgi:hypothetical protein